MKLVLRSLEVGEEAAFIRGAAEWSLDDMLWYSFDWRPGGSFTEMLERLRKNSLGLELPSAFVPSTMLYAFVDSEIVGRLSVRHELNSALRHRGGHVGYSVAARYRRRGYASEIMKQGLAFCRGRGMSELLLTCADDNIASWKVIEGVGGVLKDRVWDDVDKEMMRRYTVSV